MKTEKSNSLIIKQLEKIIKILLLFIWKKYSSYIYLLKEGNL